MTYYIGIDGGGTKTTGAISDGNQVLAERTVGPTNCHVAERALITGRIESLLNDLTEFAGVDLKGIACICFGGAGIDTSQDKLYMETVFREIGFAGKLIVCNDALTALVGANSGYEGAILISGTGSIALAVSADRTWHRVGGWGHLIGDEGSGYRIGRDGFVAIVKSFDKRGPETKLWELYRERHPFETPEDIIEYIYMESREKEAVAKFAEVVIGAYEIDAAARDIVQRAVDELFEMIVAINEIMKWEPFKLSVAGSVLTKSSLMYELLRSRIESQFKHIAFHRPVDLPVMGAVLLAVNEKKDGFVAEALVL